MCIYIYTYTYVYMYVYIYIYIYVCICCLCAWAIHTTNTHQRCLSHMSRWGTSVTLQAAKRSRPSWCSMRLYTRHLSDYMRHLSDYMRHLSDYMRHY